MNKALNMLGLCARAGKLVSGSQSVESALKSGKAKLVLVDEDASALSKKELSDACAYRGVPKAEIQKQALGASIGKPGRMMAAVTDESFAERICQLLKENG